MDDQHTHQECRCGRRIGLRTVCPTCAHAKPAATRSHEERQAAETVAEKDRCHDRYLASLSAEDPDGPTADGVAAE